MAHEGIEADAHLGVVVGDVVVLEDALGDAEGCTSAFAGGVEVELAAAQAGAFVADFDHEALLEFSQTGAGEARRRRRLRPVRFEVGGCPLPGARQNRLRHWLSQGGLVREGNALTLWPCPPLEGTLRRLGCRKGCWQGSREAAQGLAAGSEPRAFLGEGWERGGGGAAASWSQDASLSASPIRGARRHCGRERSSGRRCERTCRRSWR